MELIVQDVIDAWCWKSSIDGVYTARSGYAWLTQNEDVEHDHMWSWIWRKKIPANIQFFLWQIGHLSIPTRETLSHRGISCSSICPLCNNGEETILHCLFLCPSAVIIWRKMQVHVTNIPLNVVDLFHWIRGMADRHGSLFLIAMWSIWCSRNKVVFEHKRLSVEQIWFNIQSLDFHIQQAYSNSNSPSSTTGYRQISWLRPNEDEVVLNVDGSVMQAVGKSGFGGLIRNNKGDFLGGFYGSLSHLDINYVEILALLNGLKLCWKLGYRKILCVSDSLLTVTYVKNGVGHQHRYSNELSSIQQLLRSDWVCNLIHNLREGNQCADFLAKLGANSTENYVELLECPQEMIVHLSADANGVTFARL